jgi:hypothetical protein
MGQSEDSHEQHKVATIERESSVKQFSGTEGPECRCHESPPISSQLARNRNTFRTGHVCGKLMPQQYPLRSNLNLN